MTATGQMNLQDGPKDESGDIIAFPWYICTLSPHGATKAPILYYHFLQPWQGASAPFNAPTQTPSWHVQSMSDKRSYYNGHLVLPVNMYSRDQLTWDGTRMSVGFIALDPREPRTWSMSSNSSGSISSSEISSVALTRSSSLSRQSSCYSPARNDFRSDRRNIPRADWAYHHHRTPDTARPRTQFPKQKKTHRSIHSRGVPGEYEKKLSTNGVCGRRIKVGNSSPGHSSPLNNTSPKSQPFKMLDAKKAGPVIVDGSFCS